MCEMKVTYLKRSAVCHLPSSVHRLLLSSHINGNRNMFMFLNERGLTHAQAGKMILYLAY